MQVPACRNTHGPLKPCSGRLLRLWSIGLFMKRVLSFFCIINIIRYN
jgi:hypothetical protein